VKTHTRKFACRSCPWDGRTPS